MLRNFFIKESYEQGPVPLKRGSRFLPGRRCPIWLLLVVLRLQLMAGYVKMWTTLLSNEDFLSLPLSYRGFYLQLLLLCKLQRDDGQVVVSSWTHCGHLTGSDRKTCGRAADTLRSLSFIDVGKNPRGSIVFTIHNYHKWQGISVGDVVQNSRVVRSKNATTRPDQTRPDHSKAKHIPATPDSPPKKKKEKKKTDPRIKHFIDYWYQDYGKVFPGEKYVVQGGKDASAVKRLLGSVSLEEIQPAASWYLRLESNDWLGQLGKEINLFAMKYNEIRQRMMVEKGRYERPPD